jgi:hypothetical protein
MVCLLLKGKGEEEARATCLSCPLPDCTPEKTPGKIVRKKVIPPVSSQPDIPVTSSIISPTDILSGTSWPARLQVSTNSDESYSYGQITFRRRHIVWILEHAVTLRNGRWPKGSSDSGYFDTPIGKRQIRAEAGFIKPASVFAEVEIRLKQCGDDGHLVLGYYLGDVTLEWLARYLHCTEGDLWRRINRSIAYAASGSVRRWHNTTDRPGQTYENWKKRDRRKLATHAQNFR